MQFFGLPIRLLVSFPSKIPFLVGVGNIKERKRKILTHGCPGIKTVADLMLLCGVKKFSVQNAYGFFYLIGLTGHSDGIVLTNILGFGVVFITSILRHILRYQKTGHGLNSWNSISHSNTRRHIIYSLKKT
jgi:hypothetical protein